MTHFGSLVDLDDFLREAGRVDQLGFLFDDSWDLAFHFLVIDFASLGFLPREDILEQALEQLNIIEHKLRHVHISERSHKQELLEDFLISGSQNFIRLGFLSLGVTGSPQHGQDIPQPEIIMALFGKLFLTESIEDIEFSTETVDELVTH